MARIIVLLKDIVDLNEIKIDSSTREPKTEGVKRRISDLDKRALEAAIRLRESGVGEVLTLSMGSSKTRTAMLEALAIGADAAYIVNDEGLEGVDTTSTSIVLKSAIEKIGEYDLIVAGEMSLDSLSSQVGPRLAKLLDLPQVTYVKGMELGDGVLKAERDLEDVDEVVEVVLPAVVSVVREINEPRIPSLMNIMKAKRKPVEEWDTKDLGLSVGEVRSETSVEVLKVEAPEVSRKRVVIQADTVEEVAVKLVEAIMAEGVLEG
ncbi:MAG: electron transfer flavoprotein subunit beta/FixA family protein [Candidatus Bathyarchaeota archaeon]